MMKQNYVILGIILIIVLVLAGAVFVREKQKEPAPVTQPPVITPMPPIVTPPANPTLPTSPTASTPEGWKTYRNEELGFELAYPGEWFTYDKAKWEENNTEKECGAGIGFVHIMNGILFSKQDLGECVDYNPGLPSSEIAIQVNKGESPLDYYINQPGRKIIIIDGEKAEKVPTLKDTNTLPRNNITTIGFNHEKRSYVIYLSQTDRNGNYNPIYDQILSTFRFLK